MDDRVHAVRSTASRTSWCGLVAPLRLHSVWADATCRECLEAGIAANMGKVVRDALAALDAREPPVTDEEVLRLFGIAPHEHVWICKECGVAHE